MQAIESCYKLGLGVVEELQGGFGGGGGRGGIVAFGWGRVHVDDPRAQHSNNHSNDSDVHDSQHHTSALRWGYSLCWSQTVRVCGAVTPITKSEKEVRKGCSCHEKGGK